jgi:penicillin-binding protein 1C
LRALAWAAVGLGASIAFLAAIVPAVDLGPAGRLATLVVDREDRILRAFPAADGQWRLDLGTHPVSPNYLRFLVAIEDRRLDHHPGVDPLALGRALLQLVRSGRAVSGGSTLAMQTAKLLDPRPRTATAKAIEMLQALRLTWTLGRSGVLRAYAQLAPFGGNLVGVRAASLVWFGKEPGGLSDAEAALLVALPRSPERLRPDRHPEAARRARDRVLDRLEAMGLLATEAARAARAAPVPTARRDMPMLGAHAAEHLRAITPDAYVIETTLDRSLQEGVERVLRRSVEELPPPVEIAAIVVDRHSGAVLAYAGSAGYLARGRTGMIDHGRALRSPGSTLKPFVYGLAFDDGLAHPATLVRDAPQRFGDYAPENFDRGFSGDVTIREALRLSLNLPAVTVLDRLGPVAFATRLADASVELRTTAAAAPPGLPIVLGGVGTTLLDLAAGYTALAGDGRVRGLRWRPDPMPAAPRRLLGADAAAAVRMILAAAPRPAGLGAAERPLAFKTGTSYRFKDGWAIGFDGAHVIGVWIGRADGGSCRVCTGLGGAAPILFRLAALLPVSSLAPGPAGGSALAAAVPAPALARLETGLDPIAPRRRPVLRFAPDRARIALDPASPGVPLDVDGGTRPYLWLVDGRPLGRPTPRGKVMWRPAGPGWSEIEVIDAQGRSDRRRVWIE